MSEIKFSCPSCGQHMAIDESGGGLQVICPGCSNEIAVPSCADYGPPYSNSPPSIVGTAKTKQSSDEELMNIIIDVRRQHPPSGQLESVGAFKPSQVANARRSFAKQMTDEEIPLAMIDGSMMQNGKTGMLLTTRRLYSNLFSAPISLECITDVSVKNPDGTDFIMSLLFGVFYTVQVKLRVNGTVAYAGILSSGHFC